MMDVDDTLPRPSSDWCEQSPGNRPVDLAEGSGPLEIQTPPQGASPLSPCATHQQPAQKFVPFEEMRSVLESDSSSDGDAEDNEDGAGEVASEMTEENFNGDEKAGIITGGEENAQEMKGGGEGTGDQEVQEWDLQAEVPPNGEVEEEGAIATEVEKEDSQDESACNRKSEKKVAEAKALETVAEAANEEKKMADARRAEEKAVLKKKKADKAHKAAEQMKRIAALDAATEASRVARVKRERRARKAEKAEKKAADVAADAAAQAARTEEAQRQAVRSRKRALEAVRQDSDTEAEDQSIKPHNRDPEKTGGKIRKVGKMVAKKGVGTQKTAAASKASTPENTEALSASVQMQDALPVLLAKCVNFSELATAVKCNRLQVKASLPICLAECVYCATSSGQILTAGLVKGRDSQWEEALAAANSKLVAAGAGKRSAAALECDERDMHDLVNRGMEASQFFDLLATGLYAIEAAHVFDPSHDVIAYRSGNLVIAGRDASKILPVFDHEGRPIKVPECVAAECGDTPSESKAVPRTVSMEELCDTLLCDRSSRIVAVVDEQERGDDIVFASRGGTRVVVSLRQCH